MALCAGVSCMYLHFFCFLCVCFCVSTGVHTGVFFCVMCTCVLCRTWALSVSRSCPSCQISGIYKSRQWKTDQQASSCQTSILPMASRDSLQHALLIPMLLQTTFSVAFHWFFLACWGCATTGIMGMVMSKELHVSSGVQLCSL